MISRLCTLQREFCSRCNVRLLDPLGFNGISGGSLWLVCSGYFFPLGLAGRVVRVNVFVENADELRDYAITFESGEQASIHVDRSLWFLECAWQRDADVGVLRFAGAVDHTAHDSQLHFFHANVAAFPGGHLLAQVGLNLLSHFLEEGAGGASAARACGDLRRETANAHGL